MKSHLRHFIYLFGLLTILGSYIFYIPTPYIFFTISILGFLLSLIALIFIIRNDPSKPMLIFLLFGILTFFLRPLVKDWVISRKYISLITDHQTEFKKVNEILTSKKENISYPTISGQIDSILSPDEINTLEQFLKDTKLLYIKKDEAKIFYAVWGVPLNSDYGIVYFYSGIIPTKHYKQLKGNWYYD
jgi:hypothetical protein